jgi:phosphoribosyl-ATP pyrophosphohydrolase/phosphoribosyl-AMP cyclohydrolase
MIIPSVDIRKGRAVQLRGGRHPAMDLGDPEALALRLSRLGEIAIVDLDAALGEGDNVQLVKRLCARFPARVGGGVRTVDRALEYLDAGARYVIVGTMAEPGFLSALPPERLIAALDERDGEVMVEGWKKGTGERAASRMAQLAPYVAGFLVTAIEREGELCGIDIEAAKALVALAPGKRLTFAGGIGGGAEGARQIRELDALGADAQAGTALASGELGMAEAFAAPLSPEGAGTLWPTAVCDEGGRLLGLVYSDLESLKAAFETGKGVYKSRSRGLWVKGSSSGNTQELICAHLDCDRDAIRFTVRQNGSGFCHLGRRSCFDDGRGIEKLSRTVAARLEEAPEGSYTRRLLDDPALLRAKLREEAEELAGARGGAEASSEAADVLYFTLVKTYAEGASLADIEAELERRSLRVRRRPGGAKPGYGDGRLAWNGIH